MTEFKYADFATWWDQQTDIDDDSEALARRIFKVARSTEQAARATPADHSPDMHDAYAGAREDLAIWKKRALEAEELNRKFMREINGPTFMGEPAHHIVDANKKVSAESVPVATRDMKCPKCHGVGHVPADGYGRDDCPVCFAAPQAPQAEAHSVRDAWISVDDFAALFTFNNQISDSGADGYTASKETMKRLAELGVVQSLGFGRYGVTAFGSWLIENEFEQSPRLPLRTVSEHIEREAAGHKLYMKESAPHSTAWVELPDADRESWRKKALPAPPQKPVSDEVKP